MALIEFNLKKKKKKQQKQQKEAVQEVKKQEVKETVKALTREPDNIDYMNGKIYPIGQDDLVKPYGFWSTYFLKLWNIPKRRRYARWKKQPHKRIGVNLELKNGHHVIFAVTEEKSGFYLKDTKYLFDDVSKYWVIGLNLYFYDFHEGISIPVKREIPVNDILTAVETDQNVEVAYALNPVTIDRFERSRIAEGIMKGQVIDGMLRMIVFLIIGSMIIGTMILIIVAWKLKVFAT